MKYTWWILLTIVQDKFNKCLWIYFMFGWLENVGTECHVAICLYTA